MKSRHFRNGYFQRNTEHHDFPSGDHDGKHFLGNAGDYQARAFGKTAAEAWSSGNHLGAILRAGISLPQTALSSLSTILSRGMDLAENRDYFGNYAYDPHTPLDRLLRAKRVNQLRRYGAGEVQRKEAEAAQ